MSSCTSEKRMSMSTILSDSAKTSEKVRHHSCTFPITATSTPSGSTSMIDYERPSIHQSLVSNSTTMQKENFMMTTPITQKTLPSLTEMNLSFPQPLLPPISKVFGNAYTLEQVNSRSSRTLVQVQESNKNSRGFSYDHLYGHPQKMLAQDNVGESPLNAIEVLPYGTGNMKNNETLPYRTGILKNNETTASARSSHPRGGPCSVQDCKNKSVSKGLCILHGGGSRCKKWGCKSVAKMAGLCHLHGGRKTCIAQGCTNRAKIRGLCWSHGGSRRCKAENCMNGALTGGFCWSHGGGKRCKIEECSRPARNGIYCRKHSMDDTIENKPR